MDAHQELHQTLTVSLSPCFAKTCARLKSALGVALPQPQLIPYTKLVPFSLTDLKVFHCTAPEQVYPSHGVPGTPYTTTITQLLAICFLVAVFCHLRVQVYLFQSVSYIHDSQHTYMIHIHFTHMNTILHFMSKEEGNKDFP